MQKYEILITGGSGNIGRALTKELMEKGHSIRWLTRRKKGIENIQEYEWNVANNTIENNAVKGVDIIFHLAGASIDGKRWSKEYKQELYNSRINATNLLFRACGETKSFPKQFISSSAIGYYGFDTGTAVQFEDSQPGNDFLANLVVDWEKAADQFEKQGVTVAKMRTGIVLSQKGGALPKMALPVKFFVGAPLGSGKQYVSWIDEADVTGTFIFVMENNLSGAFNQVAPNPVTNREMTVQIGKCLNRPVFLPPIPRHVIKLLIGELSFSVLGSVKASPKRLLGKNYVFKSHILKDSLSKLL